MKFSFPNYQSTNVMPVISNLHKVKDCEFDYAYILSHLEQLEIDPTLCSKCSIANKYFASPEPFVQDLYKRSCHWQKVPEASKTMDIQPYADLVKPYHHIENIKVQHQEVGPGERFISREFSIPTRKQRIQSHCKKFIPTSLKNPTR